MSPEYLPETIRVASDLFREAYRNPGVTRLSQGVPYREDDFPDVPWIGGMPIIGFLLLPIVAGVYLFFQ